MCYRLQDEEEMREFTRPGEPTADDCLIDTLYRNHAAAIFAYLRHHSATREDAEDLLLDVFLTAMEQVKLATLAEERQVAWLWRVARNKAIDSYRLKAHRSTLALEQVETELSADESHSPEPSTLRREEYEHLQELVENLTPTQRDVLRLRFAHNLRSADIAQALGKKHAAVRVLLMRTLRHLRGAYGDLADDCEVTKGGEVSDQKPRGTAGAV